MDNLDLKQKALLELSGELTHSARKLFLDEISNDPFACGEYETLRGDYALLSSLPIPEPSAHERRLIPAQLKKVIHAARHAEMRVQRHKLLIRCATSLLIAGIAGIGAWSTWSSAQAASRHSGEQIARITSATERVISQGHKPGTYESALDDVQASIRQLETESPTLSNVYDKNLANLFDALASVPQVDGTGDWTGEDISLP